MLVATVLVPKADLERLVRSATPLRIDLDAERGRSLTLGRSQVSLVRGTGLRLRGDGRLRWDFARVPIAVTIKAWQVMLVPRIAPRGHPHVLLFEAVLEDLEVKLVPGSVDEKIADALGGYGQFVEKAEEIRPAIERAFASGRPSVVHVHVQEHAQATTASYGGYSSMQTR